MESKIKWQIGIPDERCACIVTLQDDKVSFDYFGFWDDAPVVWQRHNEYSIKAWCKLSDVEPYKE